MKLSENYQPAADASCLPQRALALWKVSVAGKEGMLSVHPNDVYPALLSSTLVR